MSVQIIGIDCAHGFERTGLARGRLAEGAAMVEQLRIGHSIDETVETVALWIAAAAGSPSLLALDAPLGWPAALGHGLSRHRAGEALGIGPHLLFARETDRFLESRLGARLAEGELGGPGRTAHVALGFLRRLHERLACPISLAWVPDRLDPLSAIEVLPLATFLSYGFPPRRYRREADLPVRRELATWLGQSLLLPDAGRTLEESPALLDAALSLLAGIHFLTEEAWVPQNLDLAMKEGWIWVRRNAHSTDA
jgi:hypothetical protein